MIIGCHPDAEDIAKAKGCQYLQHAGVAEATDGFAQVEGADEAAAIVAHRAAGGACMEGAMLGRAAWKRPWDVLSDADRHVFGAASNPAASRRQVRRDTQGDQSLTACKDSRGAPYDPPSRTSHLAA